MKASENHFRSAMPVKADIGATGRFDEIRPYRDDEVKDVIARLICDREFIDTLAQQKFKWLADLLPWCIRPLIRGALKRALGRAGSVAEFQQIVGVQLRRLLDRVADGVVFSGAEKLEHDRAYLFISNHRDIAMDPAMVDLALDEQGLATTRIAIGDNLLTKAFTSDLMRLNKSFIVKRSVTDRRQKLAALKDLSAYIQHSLEVDGESVWIAQREGRAKDGRDLTETALLKMLVLNKAKEQSFGEAFARLPIVPVAVSYEWDPCDAAKARELYSLQATGVYEKGPHEDIESIYEGIFGYKGHIEVAFGRQLTEHFADAESAARAIDRQIVDNYRLQGSHILAWQRLFGHSDTVDRLKQKQADIDWASKAQMLDARLAQVPAAHRDLFLAAYANPVQRWLDVNSDGCPRDSGGT